MNTREISEKVTELANERGWAEDDPHEQYLLTLLAAREDVRSSLRHNVQTLRANLNYLENLLNTESPILNTLGELQGRPAAVEAGVGKFAAADEALREYLEMFPGKDKEL